MEACARGWTPGPAAELFDLPISQGPGRGAVGVWAPRALEGLARLPEKGARQSSERLGESGRQGGNAKGRQAPGLCGLEHQAPGRKVS